MENDSAVADVKQANNLPVVKKDEFSEFKEKNIPSPEEFGLSFEKEEAIPIPEFTQTKTPQETPKFEEKKSFFKKIFPKKAKTDLLSYQAEAPIIVPEAPKPQPSDYPEITAATSIEPAKETKPALPKTFKVKDDTDKKIKDLTNLKNQIKKQKDLGMKEKVLTELKDVLEKKQKSLLDESQELIEKSKDIKKIENEAKTKLKQTQSRINEFTKLKKEFERKEADFSKKEEDFNLKKEKLQEDAASLKELYNSKKAKLEKDAAGINELESTLKKAALDIEPKLDELKSMKELLDQKGAAIDNKSKSSENEKKELKEAREKYLKEEIAKVKSIRLELKKGFENITEKTKKLKTINNSLLDAEDKLKVKKALLSSEMVKLAQTKKILNEKDSFLKAYPSKKRIFTLKEKQLNDKEALLNKKEEELKVLQINLSAKEKEIVESKNALEKSMIRYSREKEEVEEDEFKDYIHKKLSEITGKSQEFVQEKENVPMPKMRSSEERLRQTLEECKRQISLRNFEAAKKYYNQLRLDYYELDSSQELKDLLYNQIRTLYDDINLGMLNR